MSRASLKNYRRVSVRAFVVGAAAAAAGLWSFGDAGLSQAATDIPLQGIAAQVCTIDVVPDAAATNLPLTTAGAQRVQVGTVNQNCNKVVGYTLTVTSTNCPAAPTGGKVTDAGVGEYVPYSVEFANPATGGSQTSVTGLIASSCTTQLARDVSSAKIIAETSTVFVNYTGNTGLAAGTYTDTVTVTMNVK